MILVIFTIATVLAGIGVLVRNYGDYQRDCENRKKQTEEYRNKCLLCQKQ